MAIVVMDENCPYVSLLVLVYMYTHQINGWTLLRMTAP